ncbi:hypothetical protein I4U23_001035 [Adineta vaga]|nr:hypothetical protein I4U23_001035 [Adineta vaga]
MKGINRKSKSIDMKTKKLLHSDSNNNTNSIKKVQEQIHSSSSEHIPSTSTNACQSCSEDRNELILCDSCQGTFSHRCTKDSFLCDNCRSKRKSTDEKEKQQKLILPFNFTPKKNLHMNGLKKNQKEQIKLSTASNVEPLVQPSGEIKFRAINKSEFSSNLKRKRNDSSSPPPPSSSSSSSTSLPNPTSISNTQLNMLHHLFISNQSEEFKAPSSSSNNLILQKFCFICRKPSIKQGPSIHCDYCPLIYHLDCLTPRLISLPNEKWMCPNHVEPTLDRYLFNRIDHSMNQRVKICQPCSSMKQDIIAQDFNQRKQTKNYFLLNTIHNHRLERVDISHIPETIAEFYSKINSEQRQIREISKDNLKKEMNYQTILPSNEISSTYDPCVWDTLQDILNDIINEDFYKFSSIESVSIENDHSLIESRSTIENNTLDTIDVLLQALDEPHYTITESTENKLNNLNLTLTSTNLSKDKSNLISLTNSFSLINDLSEFHSSHAALIHLSTQHVIYLRKHTIWFGSSSNNDICLTELNSLHSCQYISERHACLYYDRKRNLFELLNYSEYGTIVNDLRYGLEFDLNSMKKIENENQHQCSCLTKSFDQPAWDGPALIEQGTVIDIGCHQFLFYRHIVR